MTLTELHAAGLSNRAIALKLGLAKVTVDRQLKALGLTSNFKSNRKVEPLEARFWKNVSRQGDCWEWQGMTNKKGYGTITVEARSQLAHRVSLKLNGVELPDDKDVLHSCDNPPCVRPSHLSVGTQADNTADMVTKGRQKGAVGSRNAKAKLTDTQVLEIRHRWYEGAKQTALAKEYGVSQPMIGYIVRKERWTHLLPTKL